MKALLLLTSVLVSVPASAAEEWNFLSATRSYEWFTQSAIARLDRSDDNLIGEARDTEGTIFRIKIDLSGDKATGTVEVVPGDGIPSFFVGTYNKAINPGPNNCWETIQLFDGHSYVGLSRNTSCEP
jgi:hypothetical protein